MFSVLLDLGDFDLLYLFGDLEAFLLGDFECDFCGDLDLDFIRLREDLGDFERDSLSTLLAFVLSLSLGDLLRFFTS